MGQMKQPHPDIFYAYFMLLEKRGISVLTRRLEGVVHPVACENKLLAEMTDAEKTAMAKYQLAFYSEDSKAIAVTIELAKERVFIIEILREMAEWFECVELNHIMIDRRQQQERRQGGQ